MATYVLIHGGGGSAWDWHLVAVELGGRNHEVVAPDLPIEDKSAGSRTTPTPWWTPWYGYLVHAGGY